MLELLIFLLAGLGLGIVMGLLPGIHPNTLILLVPFLISLPIEPAYMIVFVVSMAVSNAFVDFIPSILFSAPDSEAAFAALPGQKFIKEGRGFDAIQLALYGGLLGLAISILLIPVLFLTMPFIYEVSKPYIWMVLLSFLIVMMIANGRKKFIVGLIVVFLAGIIGLMINSLPINRNLVLFPVLSGLFGIPILILQLKSKSNKIPKQQFSEEGIEIKNTIKPSLSGTLCGILSGFLPGIGSSEIAGLATVDKDRKSFLVILGALAVVNILVSFLAILLIGNPRSGAAVMLEQLVQIQSHHLSLIILSALVAAAFSALFIITFAPRALSIIEKTNYKIVSIIIISFILFMVFVLTGIIGIALIAICSCPGVFVNLSGVKRGLLMSILIIPTILFFTGF